jgi:hypothetical protein
VFFKYGSLKILSYQSNGKGDNKFYTVQFSSSLRSLKDTFGDTLISKLDYNSLLGSNAIDFSDYNVKNIITDVTQVKY